MDDPSVTIKTNHGRPHHPTSGFRVPDVLAQVPCSWRCRAKGPQTKQANAWWGSSRQAIPLNLVFFGRLVLNCYTTYDKQLDQIYDDHTSVKDYEWDIWIVYLYTHHSFQHDGSMVKKGRVLLSNHSLSNMSIFSLVPPVLETDSRGPAFVALGELQLLEWPQTTGTNHLQTYRTSC